MRSAAAASSGVLTLKKGSIGSAGHSVSGVREVLPAAEIVRRTQLEYVAARAATAALD